MQHRERKPSLGWNRRKINEYKERHPHHKDPPSYYSFFFSPKRTLFRTSFHVIGPPIHTPAPWVFIIFFSSSVIIKGGVYLLLPDGVFPPLPPPFFFRHVCNSWKEVTQVLRTRVDGRRVVVHHPANGQLIFFFLLLLLFRLREKKKNDLTFSGFLFQDSFTAPK